MRENISTSIKIKSPWLRFLLCSVYIKIFNEDKRTKKQERRFSLCWFLLVTCTKMHTDFYTCSLQWLVHCLHLCLFVCVCLVCVVELILSTLEEEA